MVKISLHTLTYSLGTTRLNYSYCCGILVIHSNGQLDPWSAGGVQVTLKPSLPAVLIHNAAHHLDLRASNDQDPGDVIRARQSERSFISGLI